MKELFDNKQEQILFCNSGKAYIHYNEREVKVAESFQVGEDTYEEREVTKWEYDVIKIPYTERTEESVLASLKEMLIAEIDEYDKSIDVNSFVLNGENVWLPKADRVGLMNSVQIEKESGRDVSTMWFNGVSYTLNCDMVIGLLRQLELYALDCYNVTAANKHFVSGMSNVEELLNYKDSKGYTNGYPGKLTISL